MIGIQAIGSFVPSARISNLDRRAEFGVSREFIENKVGMRTLAVKAPEQETSELCVKAFRVLRHRHRIDLAEIDCLVVCTQNPDGRGLPQSSAAVHASLDLPETCAALDVSLGCSGYVYSLSIIGVHGSQRPEAGAAVHRRPLF